LLFLPPPLTHPHPTTTHTAYNIWEFYAKSAEEIALTTILSVASVTAVTLLLVPHWTAAVFVLPMISILYIDMLGVLQWAGISINPVSYITRKLDVLLKSIYACWWFLRFSTRFLSKVVMSIGLLVDFLLHVLLRFYEGTGNRVEKTVEMLHTMGSSVLIGGITTCK
jgi:predicted RND superfamily exporter protein